MTTTDERAVSAHDMAAGHFKLSRILLGIISNPTLVQPMDWNQTVWPGRLTLTGHYFDDGASLDNRRTQIAAFAAEFGLTVAERDAHDGVVVKAEGTYEDVEIIVWGLAPQDGSAS